MAVGFEVSKSKIPCHSQSPTTNCLLPTDKNVISHSQSLLQRYACCLLSASMLAAMMITDSLSESISPNKPFLL